MQVAWGVGGGGCEWVGGWVRGGKREGRVERQRERVIVNGWVWGRGGGGERERSDVDDNNDDDDDDDDDDDGTLLTMDKDLITSRLFYKSARNEKRSNTQDSKAN